MRDKVPVPGTSLSVKKRSKHQVTESVNMAYKSVRKPDFRLLLTTHGPLPCLVNITTKLWKVPLVPGRRSKESVHT